MHMMLAALTFSLLLTTACQAQPLMFMAPNASQNIRSQSATPRRAVTTVEPKEAHQWLQDPKAQWKVLDLRTPDEFAQGYIKKATLMNFYDANFKTNLLKLDRNQPYIIYCRSGARSGQALEMMRELGFKNVYNIKGGTLAWSAAGFLLVK